MRPGLVQSRPLLEPPVPGLTDPALVILIGASGAGKSTWASAHYRRTEVGPSDQLRAVVGTGPGDLEASVAAFNVLDSIVTARVRRGLTTVIDTLGLDVARRRGHVALARAPLRAVTVIFDTPPALCRARNVVRDRPVPAAALTAQLRRSAQVLDELSGEGWDEVLVIHSPVTPTLPAGGGDARPQSSTAGSSTAGSSSAESSTARCPRASLNSSCRSPGFRGARTQPVGWTR